MDVEQNNEAKMLEMINVVSPALYTALTQNDIPLEVLLDFIDTARYVRQRGFGSVVLTISREKITSLEGKVTHLYQLTQFEKDSSVARYDKTR